MMIMVMVWSGLRRQHALDILWIGMDRDVLRVSAGILRLHAPPLTTAVNNILGSKLPPEQPNILGSKRPPLTKA